MARGRCLALQVGDEMPNFTADTTVGRLSYHDMIDGVWSVLVSFPPKSDAVATTEMGQLSKLMSDFEARNVRVFGLSCNTADRHRETITDVEELEDCKVNFPIIADADAHVAGLLGLVRHGAESAIHALLPATLIVVCDIDQRIRLTMQTSHKTGRNFYELLRAIDAMQLTLFHQVATPAGWAEGGDVLVHPKLSNVAARSLFPKGVVETKPWYRSTPQPDLA
ncbi:thioredoxin-like protein [Pelagophyceae sp. CCMP2097]|nr:thioredoxin-like protein [Pelagophyceae sp. CCMP2097]|mmetsp:Transcript_1759/g.5235  ORF Transcript_1759/g.5235 Transcript_1759/m.5235 type:complete len:223 (+) Transcript_1759:106-774(+)